MKMTFFFVGGWLSRGYHIAIHAPLPCLELVGFRLGQVGSCRHPLTVFHKGRVKSSI